MNAYKCGEIITASQARDLIGTGKSGTHGGDFIHITAGDILDSDLIRVMVVFDYEWHSLTGKQVYNMMLFLTDETGSATVHIGHCIPDAFKGESVAYSLTK